MQPEKIGIYEVKSELGRGEWQRSTGRTTPFRMRGCGQGPAQFQHAAIVPVYDVGEADNQPYFVMRYISGGSLPDLIKAGGPTVEDAVRILGAIAPALDEAHLNADIMAGANLIPNPRESLQPALLAVQ